MKAGTAKGKRQGVIAGFLAVAAMGGFLAVILCLFFCDVPQGNRDLLNTALIALIGCVSTATGYYLGSSYSSAQKNDILATRAGVQIGAGSSEEPAPGLNDERR